MNFSKQEWYTLGIGIIVIIIIIIGISLETRNSDVTPTSMSDLTSSNSQQATTTEVQGKNISTDPRIQIIDVKEGTGATAKSGSTISVHYTGTFTNGKKFDSSYDRGQPISFTLGQGRVIKGWDIGLIGMKVGGKRHLIISPELGYGTSTYGPIPGNSTLVFDVELVGVK